MKNRLFLPWAFLALFFLFSKNIKAQCGNTAVEVLAANRVKAGILNSGDLFHNKMAGGNQNSNFSNIFTVPYTPGEKELSSIFSGGLWLGGLDQDSNLMTACQYRGGFNLNNPKFDFWSGPIDDSTGEVLENGCDNFDHVWKVTRADILQIIEDYADNGNIDFGVPENIKKWPARGNSLFENEMGFPLPDQDLASFNDKNNNGIYEPLNGEYPVIDTGMPLVIPDEITWCVFNDIQNEHTETEGQPLGVEVHLTAYAFNCADDELLNHTIFTKYKIIKKMGVDLTEFRAGMLTYGELGCSNDDYFGCDTVLNTLYFYNSWVDDAPGSFCDPESSYGLNPPVQAVSFLNKKLGGLVRFHGTGFCDPPILEYIPTDDISFYNYLSGKWRDGSSLTYGGNGYGNDSMVVNHLFFDNPNNFSGWSQFTVPWSVSNCFPRTVMSIVPTSLSNGDIFTLDVSYSFHRNIDSTNIGNVNVALEKIPDIQSHFDNNFSAVCTQFLYCSENCVWPGDANADGVAKEDDLLYLGVAIGQNENGPDRTPPSPLWGAHISENWDGEFFNGINLKHADFNGDGNIDTLDDDILRLNFYQSKLDYVGVQTEAPLAENELYVSTQRDVVFTWDNPLRRYSRTCVSIASEEIPFQALSGISFIIEYDTSLLEDPDWMSINFLSLTAFGDSSEVMRVHRLFSEKGQVAFGISRKDGIAVDSVHGGLVCIGVRLREDANIVSPDSIEKITFKIYDAFGATADGEIIPLGYMSDTLLASNLDSIPTFVSEFFSKEIDLEIMPNPNYGTFIIYSENMDGPLALSIFDLNGKKIWDGKMPAGQNNFTINLKENIQSGIYLLKAVREDGLFTSRRIMVK